MKELKKGSTSQSLYFFLVDSTTGLAKTGLVFNSAGAIGSYVRNRAARVAITLVTQTVTGSYSSGGFVEVDATNAKGLYRLDVPDAALVTGVNDVVITLQFTGVKTEALEIVLVDNTKGDIFSRIGAPVGASISVDVAAVKTDTAGIQTDLDNGTDGLGALKTLIDTVDTVVDAIKVITDALPDSGALTSLSTAVALATVDTVVDGIQADLDNATDGLGALKALIDTVDTVVDAIKVVTDALPDSGALTSIAQGSDLATVDTNVDSILIDTAEIGVAGAGLTDLGGMSAGMKTEVNDEVVDVIFADMIPELPQAQPPATPTLAEASMLQYMSQRNEGVSDSNTGEKHFKDDAGNVIAKKTFSDAASVYTETKAVSGP